MRLWVLVLAGCYTPRFSPCTVACSGDGACPGSLTCGEDRFCHAAGDSTDCRLLPDAAPVDGSSLPDGASLDGPDALLGLACGCPAFMNCCVRVTGTGCVYACRSGACESGELWIGCEPGGCVPEDCCINSASATVQCDTFCDPAETLCASSLDCADGSACGSLYLDCYQTCGF